MDNGRAKTSLRVGGKSGATEAAENGVEKTMRKLKSTNGQAGFTLVELMVAMGITLVLVIGTLSVFDSATRANEAGTQLANMNQNLRAGMNLMVRDLMQTGQGIPTGGIPTPNGGGSAPMNRPGQMPPGTLTFPITYTFMPAVIPGAGLGANDVNTLSVPTDILTILYADANLPLVSTVAPPNSQWVVLAANGSTMTVDASNPITGAGVNNPIAHGDIVMITCPQGSRIQTVTDVNGQVITFANGAGDDFKFNQRGAANGSVMDLIATCGAPQPPTPSPYTAVRLNMFTYYLDTTARARIPRLMRQYNFQRARAVAEVIENLQISFDLVGGVGNQVDQKTVPAGQTENQIRKINLFMAGRSDQQFSKNQQYFRNSFETQVSLRSLSFFDKYN